jgi:hypothetical protein
LALAPGTRLGVYEVIGSIGVGGMGEVYRATDTTLGRLVAIKILPDAFASDPERLARFEREAKTLASLNHPNIAAIYGFEKSAGLHALVMELVEGGDLSRHSHQEKPSGPDRTQAVACASAAGPPRRQRDRVRSAARFFLTVKSKRSMARQMLARLAVVPNAARSSVNVRSGCSTISVLSRSSCPARIGTRHFVCFRAAN